LELGLFSLLHKAYQFTKVRDAIIFAL